MKKPLKVKNFMLYVAILAMGMVFLSAACAEAYTVTVIYPNGFSGNLQTLSGLQQIQWLTDPFQPSSTAKITIIVDGQEYDIHPGWIANDGLYFWDSAEFALNSTQCKMKVYVYNGVTIASDESDYFFALDNQPFRMLDDFDDGSDPNEFGGGTGPFASGDGSRCYIPYESNSSIVLGETGYSRKLDYYTTGPSSWAGLWTLLLNADLRNYDAVSLCVKGQSGGERFQVGLKDVLGEDKVNITDYLSSGVTTSWQRVTIPFSAFNLQRWDSMDNFSITFLPSLDAQGVIYIDNIMFEGTGGAPVYIPTNTWIIDDFNDLDEIRNYRGFGQGYDDSRPSIPANLSLTEPYLHRYNVNLENRAKEFNYDVTSAGSWAYYYTLLWDYATPLDVDTLGFTHLSFRVKRELKSAGYTGCYIKIQYGDQTYPNNYESGSVLLANYALETEAWQLVNIPLSAFAGLDDTKVQGVVLAFDDSLTVKDGSFEIDNLQFSKEYVIDNLRKFPSTGSVRIDRDTKELSVDGQAFNIKGVGYQPIPIGGSPPTFITSSMCERDFSKLVEMGCNTIRTWGEPGAALMSKANEHGLKVIAGFWIDEEDYSDLTTRNNVIQNFTTFVNTYKTLPALLMWALGNENNYSNGSNPAYYSLCNELAQVAYEAEITPPSYPYHPVIIVNGDLHNIGVHEFGANDLELNYIDAWGSNAYHKDFNSVDWTARFYNWYWGDADYRDRGISWFDIYKEKSVKPVIITEYGADAFRTTGLDPIVGEEDEDMQADFVRENALDIMDASDICLGATLMAYSDEWWKYEDGRSDDGDPKWDAATITAHRSIHDTGPGYAWGDRLPDNYLGNGYVNEEWWGIMKIAPDGTWSTADGLDDIKKRKVFDVLKLLYEEEAEVVTTAESIQTAIDNSSSGDIIYLVDGEFIEDDISVNGKNNIRLVGDGAEDTIIRTNISFEDSGFSVEDLTILYKEGDAFDYSNTYYTNQKFLKDAGITAINSVISVKNCIIMPDPNVFGENQYGKGIQIWNLYGSANIEPVIENNLFLNNDAGIYLYSHHSDGAVDGAILGEIRNNTYDLNNHGIVMRMHKENPEIHHNILTRSQDAIHLTYDSLLTDRQQNITDNLFGGDSFATFGNVNDIWCDALEQDVCIKQVCGYRGGPLYECWNPYGNIDLDPEYTQPFEYPDYVYPEDFDYTLQISSDKGYRPSEDQLDDAVLATSFENGWEEWLPDDDDTYLGFPTDTVMVTLSQDRAYNGVYSVAINVIRAYDDSTGWVERPVYLYPNTTYTMNMSFWLWSDGYSDFNRWSVVAYGGVDDPEVEADFAVIGETNLVDGWKEYIYSAEVQTDENGRLYVACGITRTWETPRTYHADFVTLSFSNGRHTPPAPPPPPLPPSPPGPPPPPL